VRGNEPVLDGRTLNGDMPCQLLHKVTVCNPRPIVNLGANGRSRTLRVTPRHDCNALVDRLLSVQAPTLDCAPRGEYCRWPGQGEVSLTEQELAARLTRVPHRVPKSFPWKNASDIYNYWIDERKDFPQAMELSAAPNIVPAEKPKMPFLPSEIHFDGTFLPRSGRVRVDGGPYAGKKFLRRVKATEAPVGCVLVVGKEKPKTSSVWHAKAERAMLKLLAAEELLCVKCGDNLVHRFGAGFVLCEICESAPSVPEPHFDFNKLVALASYNRKNGGFQDEANYKRTQPLFFSVSLPELYGQIDRPLLDYELAIFLATKHPGFTQRTSLAYLKAQRAAAQLSARFLFKRTFAEITRLVPHTTENSVRMYCERAHEDFAKALRACRGVFPEEAVFALQSRMLDSLYAPSLTQGHLCHSKTCCTA
jgi:hypothetical protein